MKNCSGVSHQRLITSLWLITIIAWWAWAPRQFLPTWSVSRRESAQILAIHDSIWGIRGIWKALVWFWSLFPSLWCEVLIVETLIRREVQFYLIILTIIIFNSLIFFKNSNKKHFIDFLADPHSLILLRINIHMELNLRMKQTELVRRTEW